MNAPILCDAGAGILENGYLYNMKHGGESGKGGLRQFKLGYDTLKDSMKSLCEYEIMIADLYTVTRTHPWNLD